MAARCYGDEKICENIQEKYFFFLLNSLFRSVPQHHKKLFVVFGYY